MLRHLSSLVLLFALACSPNSSILQDKSGAEPIATPTAEAAPAEPVRKFTVAELMGRIASAPPDSFLFPCTLNAYSDQTRAALRKLRDEWIRKETSDRYVMAPSTGCVCPSICVLAVEDSRSASSWGVVVIDEKASSYVWAVRDADLSNAGLTWTGTTPKFVFKDPSGSESRRCNVEVSKGSGYTINCVDPSGRTVPFAH